MTLGRWLLLRKSLQRQPLLETCLLNHPFKRCDHTVVSLHFIPFFWLSFQYVNCLYYPKKNLLLVSLPFSVSITSVPSILSLLLLLHPILSFISIQSLYSISTRFSICTLHLVPNSISFSWLFLSLYHNLPFSLLRSINHSFFSHGVLTSKTMPNCLYFHNVPFFSSHLPPPHSHPLPSEGAESVKGRSRGAWLNCPICLLLLSSSFSPLSSCDSNTCGLSSFYFFIYRIFIYPSLQWSIMSSSSLTFLFVSFALLNGVAALTCYENDDKVCSFIIYHISDRAILSLSSLPILSLSSSLTMQSFLPWGASLFHTISS